MRQLRSAQHDFSGVMMRQIDKARVTGRDLNSKLDARDEDRLTIGPQDAIQPHKSMKIRKAVITAAGRNQRTLPLQTLIDRDGVAPLSDSPQCRHAGRESESRAPWHPHRSR